MEAIHLAAQSGQVDVINALVNEYGVDPNSKVRLLYLALCLVIYQTLSRFEVSYNYGYYTIT